MKGVGGEEVRHEGGIWGLRRHEEAKEGMRGSVLKAAVSTPLTSPCPGGRTPLASSPGPLGVEGRGAPAL